MIRIFVVVAVLLVAGCSRPADSTPSPSSVTPTTTTTSAPSSGTSQRPTTAPTAPRRLDLGKYTAKACDSLTRQQLAAIDLAEFQAQQLTSACRWSRGPETTFDVRFYPDTDPVALDYKDANNGSSPVFEPTDFDGFPAVRRQTASSPPVYNCNVAVATGPGQGFEIIALNTGSAVDWCTKVVSAGRYIVQNLGG
ncbi:DUF3558 family protein [Actinocrispum wychmicini]|uniref:Uncharacterized protein DUF3558 n=1 Tax=Actinocrispum wychmicini TaxID=1213861 RepID=A0A4R2JKW4_9PSEU|nr:DUF3558 family protein [Actinocrispum wychmicini]TCO57229.1 uncharacterized protein DUF3558 [Actinocrispum wychmicini]